MVQLIIIKKSWGYWGINEPAEQSVEAKNLNELFTWIKKQMEGELL